MALTQSEMVTVLLQEAHPGLEVRLEKIVTSGDRILDSPLARIGDRGLFVKEIEEALLAGTIDLAVHSAKDVPTELPPGLGILAYPEREDTADVFVGRLSDAAQLGEGPRTVGTSSLRRRSQLLAAFPGVRTVDIRGNVETRIRKIDELGLDGTILAAAGLRRLGRFADAAFVFPDGMMVAAVGQGSLAIEGRLRDERVRALIAPLDHEPTRLAVTAERALMRALEGGCQVPIGAHASLDGDELVLTAYVGSLDGSRSIRLVRRGPADFPERLGADLAGAMRTAGADDILADVRGGTSWVSPDPTAI